MQHGELVGSYNIRTVHSVYRALTRVLSLDRALTTVCKGL